MVSYPKREKPGTVRSKQTRNITVKVTQCLELKSRFSGLQRPWAVPVLQLWYQQHTQLVFPGRLRLVPLHACCYPEGWSLHGPSTTVFPGLSGTLTLPMVPGSSWHFPWFRLQILFMMPHPSVQEFPRSWGHTFTGSISWPILLRFRPCHTIPSFSCCPLPLQTFKARPCGKLLHIVYQFLLQAWYAALLPDWTQLLCYPEEPLPRRFHLSDVCLLLITDDFLAPAN